MRTNCTFSTEGPRKVTLEPRGHGDNSLPPLPAPPVPLLLAWLPDPHRADTPQALLPTPTPPHPRALGRSIQLFSFHLTRAGEEPYFLKKNPIQNAALPLRVPCVSLYLLYNVYKNTYFTSKVGTFLEVGPFWLVPTALKDFLRVKTWV